MFNSCERREHAAPYALPRDVVSVDECHFYHTIDVPGHGTAKGEWDLRGAIASYLGHFNFGGKRVLDVGAASGILSFYIEQQGAEVVSFDLSDEFDWDIVPFAVNNHEACRMDRRSHIKRINNSYWFCHKAFGSHAKMVNGSVYDIPDSIGPVDVAVFGSILLHLRDPFLALESGARLANEAMIVADVSPYGRIGSRFLKRPRFMPKADRPDWVTHGWFRLPPLLVTEYLKILGFPNSAVSWGSYWYRDRKVPIYTLVARR